MAFHQLSEANRDSINLNNLNISVKLHSDIIYTGDILKGVVLLRVREAIFIEVLAVEINGISEISWQDKDLDDERTDLYIYYLRKQSQTQHYDQHNILSRYKALMTNIAVQPSEENLCVPFETKIPNDCISSCSFEFGFVQYELKVSCKTVCGTKEYKQNLKIIKLTSSDSLTHPAVHIKDESKFNLQTILDKSSYQPGEDMNVKMILIKPSESMKLNVHLIQYITYTHHIRRYYKHGITRDFDQHLNQKRVIASRVISLKLQTVKEEISHTFQLPMDLTTSNHLTENPLLYIHYELQLDVTDDMKKIVFRQAIPFEVSAVRKQSNEKSIGKSTLNTVELHAAPKKIYDCCQIYKKKRNSVLKSFDNLIYS